MQIASTTRSNDAFAWTGHYNVGRSYTANGLNQYATAGSVTPTYDARGNMTHEGTRTFAFDSENRLTSASGGVTLAYDPSGRLYQTAGAATTRFAYDGADLIAEYNGSNQLQRRYVHGPGSDEPLVWYEGSGTSDRRFLHSDERGSVVAVTHSSGTILNTNSYDEYGVPAATNVGRFQYTGQAWLTEIGMYHYKARVYWPQGGRFLQTDPIGYDDGMNLYAYVGGDPVNWIDPTGMQFECNADACVTGSRGGGALGGSGSGSNVNRSTVSAEEQAKEWAALEREGYSIIVVTAPKRKRPPLRIRVIRSIVSGLDDLADWIKPPEGRRPGETYGECVERLSGPVVAALGLTGGASMGAGGALLGYPRSAISKGGGGTSLISAAARGAIGFVKIPDWIAGGRVLGTGGVGGAAGRAVSKTSVAGGAALGGTAAGIFLGALKRCQ